MPPETDSLNVYRELAERYDKLGQFSMRDRFLMLAAAAALEAGQVAEAERLRSRLLQQNRHHMLRPYRSFEEAIASQDVLTYLLDLQANYPPDLAARLLTSLIEGKSPPVTQKPLAQRKPSAAPKTQTAPANSLPSAANVPPTAPLVDPYEQQAVPATKLSWEPPANPPQAAEVEQTMPVPDRIPVMRPRAQPVPDWPDKPRLPQARKQECPPIERTMPVPLERPKMPTRAALYAAPQPVYPEATSGEWLSLLLTGVVATAAVVVAAFTLARPFLPPDWIP